MMYLYLCNTIVLVILSVLLFYSTISNNSKDEEKKEEDKYETLIIDFLFYFIGFLALIQIFFM
jgi:cell division protein FtsW (lipid II flippase)